MTHIIRAVVFMAPPVYFYFRPFMPEPLQIQFVAFAGTVVVSETILALVRNRQFLKWSPWLPLIAGTSAVLPYRTYLEYFDTYHLGLMLGVIILGICYGLVARNSLRKS